MSRLIAKNSTIFFCCFLIIFFPAFCLAENEKVADIKKDQPAPFDGILMTNGLATKLYLDSKFSSKECDIKIKEKLELSKIAFDSEKKLLESKLQIETDRFNKIIEAKDGRIDFLEKRWSPRPWYDSGVFWMSIGVVSGILITAVAAHSISSVSR